MDHGEDRGTGSAISGALSDGAAPSRRYVCHGILVYGKLEVTEVADDDVITWPQGVADSPGGAVEKYLEYLDALIKASDEQVLKHTQIARVLRAERVKRLNVEWRVRV